MEDFIQLKKSDVLKIEIVTDKGEKTGEYLEFDMGDIELPLKLNECDRMHKKNLQYVKMQFIVIDKREDKKGKFLLSVNEEEKMKVLKDFYEKEEEALDLFIGKGGTKKLLNGRSPYWGMFEDFVEILTPILPKLKCSIDNISSRIKEKYSIQEENVIK